MSMDIPASLSKFCKPPKGIPAFRQVDRLGAREVV
jgi:hypothetical protein